MSASNGLATVQPSAIGIMEQVIIKGDLSQLTPQERLTYYIETCQSLGLNPLTKPFDYIQLDSGLTLYAKRDATDQLRSVHGVSTKIVNRELVDGVYIVTAQATTKDGRTDESTGAVPMVKEDGEWKTSQSNKRYFAGNGTFRPLSPADRANAIMKAETKAKRRVTLSICGLGWMDETEIETVATAQVVTVNPETGEINERPPMPSQPDAPSPLDSTVTDFASTRGRRMPPEPTQERVTDWTVMWSDLRNRNIDPATYESIVGKKAQSFSDPQAALDALRDAEDAIADDQGETVDGEFEEVVF